MKIIYDLVVIGGGPAGIISSIVTASRGTKVLLLEKNKILGKKLLISGNGRCNITQAEFDVRKLVSSYGANGAFLFSALHQFGPREVMDFFKDLGIKLKIEEDGRVFPVSDSAKEIIQILKKNLQKNKVEVRCESEVVRLEIKKGLIDSVVLTDDTKIFTKNLIIATGGLSYNVTGSTGDGLEWARSLGHEVVSTIPALVPLKIKESWTKDLQGLALKNVELKIFQNNKKISSKIGDIIFTHFGISGPAVLNISKVVIKAEKNEEVKIKINFFPGYSLEKLDKELRIKFQSNGGDSVVDFLSRLVPRRMAEMILAMSKMENKRVLHGVTRVERLGLCNLLIGLELTVVGNMGYDMAIVTSGGVSLGEIDPSTMCSKKISNLYFAGEVVDIDGPTGGYNLQVAWATGYLAGKSIKI